MNASYKRTIHFGSGKPGKEVVEFSDWRAKDLKLINAKGEPNISGYLVYLINEDRKSCGKRAPKHP